MRIYLISAVIICLIPYSHEQGPTGWNQKSKQDKVTRFLELGYATASVFEKALEAQNQQTLCKFGQTFKKFSAVASPAFLALSFALSFVIPGEDETMMKEIKIEFEKVHQRFDVIERKLDLVIDKIEEVAFRTKYSQYRERSNTVWDRLELYLAYPSNGTKELIQLSCKDSTTGPDTILNTYYRLIVNQEGTPNDQSFTDKLIQQVNHYDIMLLQRWSIQLIDDLTKANYLLAACLGLDSQNQRNETQKQQEINHYLNRTQVIAEKLDEMILKDIKEFTITQLENDVTQFITFDLNVHQVAAKVYETLKAKYFLFNWWVICFDGDNDHYVRVPKDSNNGINYFYKKNGDVQRNVMIVWKNFKYKTSVENDVKKLAETNKDNQLTKDSDPWWRTLKYDVIQVETYLTEMLQRQGIQYCHTLITKKSELAFATPTSTEPRGYYRADDMKMIIIVFPGCSAGIDPSILDM
jgi:hypothetical protein